MKKEFIEYLKSIGIPVALFEKIETIYELYKELCPDEIMGIFVTDYIKEDGSREYENLWFFSEKTCMEAKQFITKEDFDIIRIKKRVNIWNIRKYNYNFKKATDTSRLFLRVNFDFNVDGELKAAKDNCDYLRKIILKYVVPNLKQ